MGEPLAPSVGKWFATNFLKYDSSIVNTYFQTETGGIICSQDIIKILEKYHMVQLGSLYPNFSKSYLSIQKS